MTTPVPVAFLRQNLATCASTLLSQTDSTFSNAIQTQRNRLRVLTEILTQNFRQDMALCVVTRNSLRWVLPFRSLAMLNHSSRKNRPCPRRFYFSNRRSNTGANLFIYVIRKKSGRGLAHLRLRCFIKQQMCKTCKVQKTPACSESTETKKSARTTLMSSKCIIIIMLKLGKAAIPS